VGASVTQLIEGCIEVLDCEKIVEAHVPPIIALSTAGAAGS
jgi:hypothetical protein